MHRRTPLAQQPGIQQKSLWVKVGNAADRAAEF